MEHDLTQEGNLMISKVSWSVALRTFYQIRISLTCLIKLNIKENENQQQHPHSLFSFPLEKVHEDRKGLLKLEAQCFPIALY